jgi:hypothetical protein
LPETVPIEVAHHTSTVAGRLTAHETVDMGARFFHQRAQDESAKEAGRTGQQDLAGRVRDHAALRWADVAGSCESARISSVGARWRSGPVIEDANDGIDIPRIDEQPPGEGSPELSSSTATNSIEFSESRPYRVSGALGSMTRRSIFRKRPTTCVTRSRWDGGETRPSLKAEGIRHKA